MSLKVTKDLINDRFDLVDEFDYSGESYPGAATQMGIKFKIIDPSGTTHYINTSTTAYDIYPDSDTQFTGASLPTDGNGNILQGDYQIIMTRDYVDVNGEFVENKDVVTYNYTYRFTTPTAQLSITVNYFTPVITSEDTTNYSVNGILPTHNRTNQIIFPQVLDPVPSPVSGSGPSVSTNDVYTDTGGLTYTFNLENYVTYELANEVTETLSAETSTDPLYVLAEVAKNTTTIVESPAYICQVYCALKKLMDRYESVKCGNSQGNLADIRSDIIVASAYMTLMRSAYECGKTSHAIEFKNAILKLTGSTEDCDCCDGEGPQLVQGLGGQGGHTIVEGVNGQTVVEFDGDSTYTVGLSDQVMDAIAGLDINIQSSSLDVSSTVVNGQTIWTINVQSQYRADQLDVILEFDMTPAGLPTVSIVDQSLKGDTFQEVTIGGGNSFFNYPSYISGFSDYEFFPALFDLENFIDGGGNAEFYPEAEIVHQTRTDGQFYDTNYQIEAMIQAYDNNSAVLRLRRADGASISGAMLEALAPIKFRVKLTFTA